MPPKGRLLSDGRTAGRARVASSRKQERETAASISGKTTPGSGSTWHSKADVVSPSLMVECKETQNDSISLKAKDFKKVKLEALLANKQAVMQLKMNNLTLAVISWDDFIDLVTNQRY